MIFYKVFLFLSFLILSLEADIKKNLEVRVMVDVCITCHGDNTKGLSCSGFPPIAGKNKIYLKNRMLTFKKDEKGSVDMHRYAIGYSDTEIETISDYLSRMGEK